MMKPISKNLCGMTMEVFLLLMGTGSVIMAYSPSTHAHAHFNSRSSSASTPTSSSSSSRSASSSSKLMGSRDITFSPGRLNELGSRGQWLLRHIALMTHTCGIRDMASMRRKLLRKSDVTCNDGSYAGYYIRRSRGSNKWIVFLEGGWYCFDHVSCSERSRVMPDFMSSRNWPRFRSGSGILSWDPEENPYYFHANIVYVPYCSSDSWTGTRNSTTAMKFSFMGSLILDEVFNELLQKGMRRAQTVLIAGTSAGATGVLVNIDRIAELIHARKPTVDVRGLVDSGWFLDMPPFKEKTCRDAFTCSPIAGMQRGVQVWNPRLPKACVDAHPEEIWRCYFGRRVFPSIKTPVYIIQNLYDAAQIQVSNVLEEQHTWPRGELSSDQWRYLLDLGQQVKDTLQNVSAVFAPGCVSHEILNKPEWHNVRIEGTSLAESIYCWESRHSALSSCQQSSMDPMLSKNNNTPLADSPPSSRKKRKRGRKRRKKKGKKRRKNREKKRKSVNSRRLSRAAHKKCRSHLIDLCPWPHCNCSCPKCRWETLNKVRRYFLRSLATVMGIDPAKMNNVQLCGY